MVDVEHGFSVTQIREPFSAGCLACEVTNGVPKPCDAELAGESNFSQRTRPPRRVRVVSSCFRTAPLTCTHMLQQHECREIRSPLCWRAAGRGQRSHPAHCSEEAARSCAGGFPQGGDRCSPLSHRCCHQDPHRVCGTGRRPWDTRCKELLLFAPSRAERGGWWEGASSLPSMLLCGIGLSGGTTRAEMQPMGGLQSSAVGLSPREDLLASGWH